MKGIRKVSKKLVAVLMIAMLACGIFSGCGNSGSSGNDGGSEDGVIQLTLWSTYGTYGTQYLQKLVDDFNKSQDKYNLEISSGTSADGIRTKVMASAQKDYPSLICGTPATIANYADANYVVPLQKFIDSDSEDFTAQMFDAVKASYSDKDGNMIGHPMGVSFNGYIVNLDILEKTGYELEDLTSFEKIASIATEAVKKGHTTYGISFASGQDMVDMLTMQGVECLDAGNGLSGEITKAMYQEGETNSALKKAMNIFTQLVTDKVAMEYGSTSANASVFMANKLLFWKATNSSVHNMEDANSNINWAFIPSVGVDENAKYKGCALSEGTGLFICDTVSEKEQQGAYEFIKFIAQKDNQNYFATGIGYVSYTKDAVDGYVDWAKQGGFPNAESVLAMLENSPADLRLPYASISSELADSLDEVMSKLASNPKADLDEAISGAATRIENAIKIWKTRMKGDK